MDATKRKWMSALKAGVIIAALGVGAAHAHTSGRQQAQAPRIDYAKVEETAFGKAADPRRAKTIVVQMDDNMRFTPAEIVVDKGDIVRFEVKNRGKVLHEMVLGTREELAEHAEMMKKHPGMEHDEPHMAHVSPGESGEIGWQFTRPGEFVFACLVPGHFEAGMIGRVVVRDTDKPRFAGPDKGPAVMQRHGQ